MLFVCFGYRRTEVFPVPVKLDYLLVAKSGNS